MGDQDLVIGIVSIGEMGLGIANFLINHGYRVATFAEDRSKYTRERAQSINVQLLPSINDLISLSAVILSITNYYLDLNDTAASLATRTHDLLSSNPNIINIDGGIIGGPPRQTSHTSSSPAAENNLMVPSLVVSGPTQLPYPDLVKTLNIDHVSSRIGAASGVKLCFASTTKGFFAIAIQSYVTAEPMGVFPELRKYMAKHNSQTLEIADKGVVEMPPKAYRWVNEMQQIGEMMDTEGDFGSGLFDGVAKVYRVVAEDTELGLEQTGRRNRGTTVEDVVAVMREGMKSTKKKSD
ncbi:6-phosphogluconate dehydrogenase [Aspergillus aurantiobrunneus]